MASKQPLKLFDVKKKMYRAFLAVESFIKHSVFRRKRNVIIIGEADTPILRNICEKLQKYWMITHLQCRSSSNQLAKSIGEQALSKQSKNNNDATESQSKSSHNLKIQQISFSNNFSEIEKRLSGQQFNAIVVLPQKSNQSNLFDIQDEQFVTAYPCVYDNLIMRNIFAYRLAHKYLTKTGVVILSCGHKQFVRQKQEQSNKEKAEGYKVEETQKRYWTSRQLINSQISYLGFVMGDRQYIGLESHSVIALSKELCDSDPDLVTNSYLNWILQRNLPSAGSFALFRDKSEQSRSSYIEYL